MKLVHVSIHNFRGIHDASINLHDYNLLVGPNNAGKSTAIAAILVFYEKDGFKFKAERAFPLCFVFGDSQGGKGLACATSHYHLATVGQGEMPVGFVEGGLLMRLDGILADKGMLA